MKTRKSFKVNREAAIKIAMNTNGISREIAKKITVSVHLDEWIIYIMCVLIKCFKTVTSMANTAQPPYSRQKKR